MGKGENANHEQLTHVPAEFNWHFWSGPAEPAKWSKKGLEHK